MTKFLSDVHFAYIVSHIIVSKIFEAVKKPEGQYDGI